MTKKAKSFPRPIASVDLAIFALSENGLDVLLMRRSDEPFAGEWALPGGWIRVGEDADLAAAARRVLKDKTGVETPYLEQFQSVGNAERDPRGWSLSIGYFALMPREEAVLASGGNAADVEWWPLTDDAVAVPLAFDHAALLATAANRLRSKVEYSSLPAHLLAPHFTLGELQSVYERILGRRLDKSAFRKRISEADFVEPVEGEMRRGSNRPAQLYRLRAARSAVLFDRTI